MTTACNFRECLDIALDLLTDAINHTTSIKAHALKRMAELVTEGQRSGEIAKAKDTLRRGPVLASPENGAVSLADLGITPYRLAPPAGAGDFADYLQAVGLAAMRAELDAALCGALAPRL